MTDQEVLSMLIMVDKGYKPTSAEWEALSGVRQLSLKAPARLPEGLRLLEGLKTLVLTGREVTDLSPLKALTSLTFLSVTGTGVREVGGLSGLTAMQYLDLSGNEDLTDIGGLSGMTSLCYLRLSGTGVGDLTPLSGLGALNYLDLSSISCLSDLRPLAAIRGISYLDVSSCTKLSEVEALAGLSGLTCLKLAATAVEDIRPLRQLSGLTSLDLSHTQVQSVAGLEGLTALRELNLGGTRLLKGLPPAIGRMRALKTLVLENAVMSSFPAEILDLGLAFLESSYRGSRRRPGIYIHGLKLTDQAIEVFSQDRDLIARYLKSRKEREPINECKVVFLGDGGVGKSLMIDRLMHDGQTSPNFNGDATPGICISNRQFEIGGNQITLHFWDFGGQAIMHSMHRLFLTNRTLYVIVVNARDNKANEQAWYWIRNLKSFANNAPVFLLVNQKDQNPSVNVNENGLRMEYASLKDVGIVSALTYSQEEFNKEVRDVLCRIVGEMDTVRTPFPREWLALMDDLETMADNYITENVFYTKCVDHGIEKNKDLLDQIIGWYQDLGVCFYSRRHPASGQYMVLKPRWLLNALYILVFNGRRYAKNGTMLEKDIYGLICEEGEDKDIRKVWPDIRYKTHEIQYILTVLLNFEMIYRLDNERFFIPMLCDENQPLGLLSFDQEEALHVSFKYTYLPDNVLHKLMVSRGYELDLQTIWRSGATFKREMCGWSSFVCTRDNNLNIYVSASDRLEHPVNSYMDMLREDIYRINETLGLKAEEYVIYHKDGREEAFKFKTLLGSKKTGLSSIYSDTFDMLIDIDVIIGRIEIPERLLKRSFDARIDKLLNALMEALQSLQSNRVYYGAHENECNAYVRDLLEARGYICKDETHYGVSGSGHSDGELDILIRDRDLGTDLTIYEALRLGAFGKKEKDYLDGHLAKLLDNYNAKGLPYLFLVSYVSWDKEAFDTLANEYSRYINGESIIPFKVVDNQLVASYNGAFIRCHKTCHDCGGIGMQVYHILVRVAG